MSLGFPPLVWSRKFCFFVSEGERGCVFAVFFAPFPEKGILDYIAHRPIIQVFTVQVFSGGRADRGVPMLWAPALVLAGGGHKRNA